MCISLKIQGDFWLFQIKGRFDLPVVVNAQPEIEDLLKVLNGIAVVDFSECKFIDTAGVGLILGVHKRLLGSGQRLHLYGMTGQPKQLLEFLRVDRALPVLTKLELTRPMVA